MKILSNQDWCISLDKSPLQQKSKKISKKELLSSCFIFKDIICN